jgi:hypothetical protein
MAGEKLGELFEAFTFCALKRLGYREDTNLHWGKAPKDFSIECDFIVGQLNKPETLLMLTNAGAGHNTHMKFWRDLAELFEAKRSFSPSPLVISLNLSAKVKAALKTAADAFADSVIRLDETPYGLSLLTSLDRLSEKAPSSRDGKVEFIEALIKKETSMKRVASEYAKTLNAHLTKKSNSPQQLWAVIQSHQGKVRKPRVTSIRRGIGKMLLFSHKEVERLFGKPNKILSKSEVPSFGTRNGFYTATIGGLKLVDPEILSVLQTFPMATIQTIMESAIPAESAAQWNTWKHSVRDNAYEEKIEYITKHWRELRTPRGMLHHLSCHNPSGERWLLILLFEILKLHLGGRQSYGYARLAGDVGYREGIAGGYLVLFDWTNNKLKKSLPPKLLPDVATALAKRVAPITEAELNGLVDGLAHAAVRNLLEYKMLPYWKYEPLPAIITAALDQAKLPYKRVDRHPTFIGEYIEKPRSTATTPLILVKHSAIHWKTAHSGHCNDKTKELSARAQAVRVQFAKGRFKERGFRKLCLVLDGDFKANHISTLVSSGWDEIFYPDEMGELVKAIV